MPNRLVIDGNSVYEIDEDCEKSRNAVRETRNRQSRTPHQNRREQKGSGGRKDSRASAH